MLKTKIENNLCIAKFLNESKDIINLEVFSKQICDQRFYLPIVGQFSAGKSHLINNLLGQKLLPTKLRETTAVLTFISYGKPQANAVFSSGKTIEMTLAEIQVLDHKKIENDAVVTQSNDGESDKIVRLNITIEHELLKSGVVIVDTPGVNTIVNEHEMFTQNILPETLALVYVFNTAPSAVDMSLLEKIQQYGINTTFVRTYLDQINTQSESIESCEQADQNILEKYLSKEKLAYFAVSNDVSDGWQDRMNTLYDHILYDIAFQAKSLMETGIEIKLNQLSEKYQQLLSQQLCRASELVNSSADEVNNKLKIVKNSERSFLRKCRTIEEKINSATQQVQLNVESIINRSKKAAIASFLAKMQHYTTLAKIEKDCPDIAQQQIDDFVEGITIQSQQEINRWVNEIQAGYEQEVIALSDELKNLTQLEFIIPVNELGSHSVDKAHYQNVLDDLGHLMELQEKSESELRQLNINNQDLLATQSHLKEVVAQIVHDQAILGDYQPQYMEIPGDNNISAIGKQIGALADIALLFTPVVAVEAVAGVAKAGKVIQGANKAKKAMDYVNQGVQIAAKCKQGVNGLQRTPIGQGMEKTGLFDLLSLEYWFEKVGRKFDTPPIKILDLEHQANLQQEKSRVSALHQTQIEKELTLRHEIENFTSQQQKENMRLELVQKKQHDKQQELNVLQQKSEQACCQKYKQQCVELFCQSLASPVQVILPAINKHIANTHNDIMNASTKDIMLELAKIESELKLFSNDTHKATESKAEIDKINVFIKQLSEQDLMCV
ncbi:dynamin family protein [Psychromonas sp. Urea-02u-13]|uniref:dynamin family protein n=1 Tax=Psychromonas sp. Urea-02u-13 TaxID=2058326 RepID=UPI000C347EDB|nr:dynamin family protein [Psychromonas sp. Urea-02u-13]PKG38331.1 hypothetical protein CXF74_14170 [Psychromonas sp. Urea-02u-13]